MQGACVYQLFNRLLLIVRHFVHWPVPILYVLRLSVI